MANSLKLHRTGAVGFIEWLDALRALIFGIITSVLMGILHLVTESGTKRHYEKALTEALSRMAWPVERSIVTRDTEPSGRT